MVERRVVLPPLARCTSGELIALIQILAGGRAIRRDDLASARWAAASANATRRAEAAQKAIGEWDAARDHLRRAEGEHRSTRAAQRLLDNAYLAWRRAFDTADCASAAADKRWNELQRVRKEETP
jgi:hypothetical protein